MKKVGLSKGYQNPKRKLAVNHAFFRDNYLGVAAKYRNAVSLSDLQ